MRPVAVYAVLIALLLLLGTTLYLAIQNTPDLGGTTDLNESESDSSGSGGSSGGSNGSNNSSNNGGNSTDGGGGGWDPGGDGVLPYSWSNLAIGAVIGFLAMIAITRRRAR